MNSWLRILSLLVVSFTGGLLASYLWLSQGVGGSSGDEIRLAESSATLTNPLLECDLGPTYLSENTTAPFRDRIDTEIKNITAGGEVSMVAYYFRDLNNGAWFGFNEREQFVPASLAKVPLLISALAKAEEQPGFLDLEVEYAGGDASAPQFIPPKNPVQVGKTYSIKELLEHTITQSDNNAALLVSEAVTQKRIFQTFTDLGLVAPTAGEDTTISVRNYSSFFRILYNASYLSRSYSEAALSLLINSEFKDGLRAGLPEEIPVAHKFGERIWEGKKQFHDCGIVYYPKKPYVLCIMTRGEDYPPLVAAIKQLSQVTYQEVKKQD